MNHDRVDLPLFAILLIIQSCAVLLVCVSDDDGHVYNQITAYDCDIDHMSHR